MFQNLKSKIINQLFNQSIVVILTAPIIHTLINMYKK